MGGKEVEVMGEEAFMLSFLKPVDAEDACFWEPVVDVFSQQSAISDFGLAKIFAWTSRECEYLMGCNTHLC